MEETQNAEKEGPWVAHYWRHYAEEREPFDTSAAAVAFLEYGEDMGTLSTQGVIRPDGVEVLCPFHGGSEAEWDDLRESPVKDA